MNISVVILTKDEAANIGAARRFRPSMTSWLSTVDRPTLREKLPPGRVARVLLHPFQSFAQQRNWCSNTVSCGTLGL